MRNMKLPLRGKHRRAAIGSLASFPPFFQKAKSDRSALCRMRCGATTEWQFTNLNQGG